MTEQAPIAPVGEAERPSALPLLLVVALGACSGFGPLSIDMYLPGLPALQRHFHAPAAVAQLTLTACLVGLAVAQLFIGPLSDRLGRRGPLLVGVVAYALVSVGSRVAPWLPLFIVLRLLQGAAGAAGIVISRAIVRDLRSGSASAQLFAMLFLVNGFFPALAPILGAQILRFGSWRSVFVVLAVLGIAQLGLVARCVPETLAEDEQARRAGGLAETLDSYRMLLRDRRFVGYAVSAGCTFGAMFAYISGSPFVLEDLFGLSPQEFSGVFAMNAVGIVLASQLGARFVHRIGATPLLLAGQICTLAGGAGLVLSVVAHLGLAGVLVSLFLVVSSVGLVAPNASALAMADYPEVAGSASGAVGVLQFLIGGACAPIVGAFGTHTAVPMTVVIAVLSSAAFGSSRFGKRNVDVRLA